MTTINTKCLLTQMLLHPLVCVLSIFGLVFGEQNALKLPFSNDDQAPYAHKVAIIGVGIAGVSAAYHLHDQYPYANLDLTIYEANPQVGGRIKSAKVYDGTYTSQQVETGAQSFYADDECVQSLVDETGLRRKLEPHYPVKKSVGVWDGASFILQGQGDLKGGTWTDWARYTWRYGFSSTICANGSPKSFHYFRDYLEGGNMLIGISLGI